MSMMSEIRREPDRVRVVVGGVLSLQEARQLFLQVLDLVVRENVPHVLLDARSLSGHLQTMERFNFAKFTAETVVQRQSEGLSPSTKFACVLTEPLLDPERFGETVAVNRGMHIKVFDSMDEAMAWLELPAEAPQMPDHA